MNLTMVMVVGVGMVAWAIGFAAIGYVVDRLRRSEAARIASREADVRAANQRLDAEDKGEGGVL